MTYTEAITEARKRAMEFRLNYVVYYYKLHWWNRKQYDYMLEIPSWCEHKFAHRPGFHFVARFIADGKTH